MTWEGSGQSLSGHLIRRLWVKGLRKGEKRRDGQLSKTKDVQEVLWKLTRM